MALSTELVPNGYLHARSLGLITAGAGYGQVPAPGAGQLLKVLLPFSLAVTLAPGYQDQMYIFVERPGGTVSAVALDAQQFETDPATGASVLRLRVDVSALPAPLSLHIDAEHSATR